MTLIARRSPALAALALAALLSAPVAAHAAGRVQVKWIEPEKFSDAGRGTFDRERTLQTLSEHLLSLGQRLPTGQTLDVEVTNVELAGELEPFGRFHDEVRVLRGRADWPRISLRYTLSEGASTLASGQADLSDPDYFHRLPRSGHQGVLGYEKRMLDDWVASLVAAKR
jgi:hypothetical protein